MSARKHAYSTEKLTAYLRDWRERRRQDARARLGGKCAKCGSADELEFDHIDPNTKVLPIGQMWHTSRAKFESELAKCQLLCKDCHLAKSRAEGSLARNKPRPLIHGTEYAYSGRGCRCEPCRDAKRASRSRAV